MARILIALASLLVYGLAPLYGQTLSSPADPFGRIFSASIRPEVQDFDRRLFAAPAESYALLSLSLRDSESATSGSFSGGYGGSVRGRSFYLSGTYSHVDPADAGDSSNRASAYGQMGILEKEGFASLAGVVTAAYDPDAFKAYGFLLVADGTIIAERLTATANFGWTEVNPDNGESVNALQPSIGLVFSPNDLWTFSMDYTFENDVDGEDTGSFAASLKVPQIASKLKLTGEKHNVYALSLTRRF